MLVISVIITYIHRMTFVCYFFFFNDTATTEIYTLSLHDALPISEAEHEEVREEDHAEDPGDHHRGDDPRAPEQEREDRKSTRLNSSHSQISYAVFCLKKKKNESLSITRCVISKKHASQNADQLNN